MKIGEMLELQQQWEDEHRQNLKKHKEVCLNGKNEVKNLLRPMFSMSPFPPFEITYHCINCDVLVNRIYGNDLNNVYNDHCEYFDNHFNEFIKTVEVEK